MLCASCSDGIDLSVLRLAIDDVEMLTKVCGPPRCARPAPEGASPHGPPEAGVAPPVPHMADAPRTPAAGEDAPACEHSSSKRRRSDQAGGAERAGVPRVRLRSLAFPALNQIAGPGGRQRVAMEDAEDGMLV